MIGKFLLLFILWGNGSPHDNIMQQVRLETREACMSAQAFLKEHLEDTDEQFADKSKDDATYERRFVDSKCVADY